MLKRIQKKKQSSLHSLLLQKKNMMNSDRSNNVQELSGPSQFNISSPDCVQNNELPHIQQGPAENFVVDNMDDDLDDSYSNDEHDELHSDLPRNTRGPTTLPDIWNRGPDEKLPEQFNAFDQCVDDGELGKFCGTVAINPDLTPLEYDDWRNVPSAVKDEIWRVIKTKFDITSTEGRKSWVLKEVGKLLKEFRTKLYLDNFSKYKSLAELKANVDTRTRKDQWEKLAAKWYSPKWQEKSENGRKAGTKMTMPHTSGTISFARRAEMKFKATGKRPSRAQLYVDHHKHKDGTPVTSEAAEALTKIERILQVQGEVESSQQADDFTPLEIDALGQVLGPEKSGRVRGMGFRVTPSMFSKSKLESLRENEIIKEKNKKLEDKVVGLTEELAGLKDMLLKQAADISSLGFRLFTSHQSHDNDVCATNETLP